MKTKQELVKEIRSLLLESDRHWADTIWSLMSHGYHITGITSYAGDTLKSTEETLYIYRFEKDNEAVNVGIMVEESKGITDVFEVKPRTMGITIWERY